MPWNTRTTFLEKIILYNYEIAAIVASFAHCNGLSQKGVTAFCWTE